MVERLGEMRKGRREKGSIERIEKRERAKKFFEEKEGRRSGPAM